MAAPVGTGKINVYTQPPDGVSRNIFRNVVAAAHMAYQLHNRDFKNREANGRKTLPDVDEITKYCNHTKQSVSRVIATEEFRMAMREKGVYWTARDGLTPEQVYCIGIMTNPADKRDMNGKLKAAGITYQVYRGWLKQPSFRAAVHRIGEEMLDDHIADVNTALVNKAVGGDIRAIELYNQITGRFDPGKQQMADLQQMVNMLLETIFRYVTDVSVLRRITDEFDKALTGRPVEPTLLVEGKVVDEKSKAIDMAASRDDDSGNDDLPPVDIPVFDDSIPEGFFDFYEGGK